MNVTPRLEIFPERIAANAHSVLALCRQHGVQIACVTKVACAHPAVAGAMVAAGAERLGDWRVSNLYALKQQGHGLPLLLLRLPAPAEATDVVTAADVSLNSSLVTLRALSDAALGLSKRHGVILMIDVGDLREGIWPDQALATVKAAKDLAGIEVLGLGCNLACYGGVIPSPENTGRLVEIRDACRRETGLELALLSGGNSSGLPLLAAGRLPREINHFRVGEAIVLGRNVIDRSPWPGTRQDTFRAVATIVELERKPSMPIGQRGQDAFGETRTFVDRGIRLRAICNLGRQDVVPDGIEPCDGGVIVLGASSDHLILDVEDAAGPLAVGDEIAFFPGYGALLALSTSPYVRKVVVKGK